MLSVGDGHLEIRFKKDDPIEIERAKRIITDMLKRGYSLFVHGKDDVLTRVKRFDAKTGTYIIADGPTVAPLPTSAPPEVALVTSPKKRGRHPKGETAIHMTEAHATVIGRSAGG